MAQGTLPLLPSIYNLPRTLPESVQRLTSKWGMVWALFLVLSPPRGEPLAATLRLVIQRGRARNWRCSSPMKHRLLSRGPGNTWPGRPRLYPGLSTPRGTNKGGVRLAQASVQSGHSRYSSSLGYFCFCFNNNSSSTLHFTNKSKRLKRNQKHPFPSGHCFHA